MECPETGYYIDADRLDEQDWVSHMCCKTWVDKVRFIDAYKRACRNAGIKVVPKGYNGDTIPVEEL